MSATKKSERACTFHVIPNTHWDREWLYDFQETRMLLVEFMDRLLDIFARHDAYKTYLLDSQTIPIEDYLAIRPERRDEIVRRVREGRLLIGPWYTLPEEHLVNGESLVRNLLLGGRLAESYGGTMKIGYSPFSYGQASQMPQIYRGFGIDTILFYHGIQPSEAPSEFIFEGPDGSQLFASRMGSNARYNFFFSVYRPAVFGKATLERDYRWSEQGLPFHLCSEDQFSRHHMLVDPVRTLHRDRLASLLDELKQAELQHVTTDHIACMQGMDSTQPDVHELKTVEELAKILATSPPRPDNDAARRDSGTSSKSEGKDVIFHSSLPEWLDAVKRSVRWEDLVVLKGERRTPRQLGTRVHLYGDVTSTRVRIKRKNARAEQELQRRAEPLAAAAWLIGAEYPRAYLDLAWKYLFQCHPHDSIAGTGVDPIEHDVHHRLDQCRHIAAGVKRRALQAIQHQIDNGDLSDETVVLTVFNSTPYRRSEVVTAVVDLPLEGRFANGGYMVRDGMTDEPIEVQEAGRWEHPAVVRHLGDATMEMPSLRVRLRIPLDDVPGLGYRTLLIRPDPQFSWPDGSLVTGPNTMENEHLKVVINPNGTFDLTDKMTGQTFTNLHYFSDNGEAGHAWRHIPPCHDRVFTTLHGCPTIERLETGPFSARFAVTHTLELPARLDEGKGDHVRRLDGDGDDAGRSAETRRMTIRSELSIDRYARGVAVTTTFDNTCEDHRLRVMFPTHLAASTSSAEEPFDVVERPIDRGPESPWRGTWNPTHPCQRFVDVSDGKLGLALVNDGLREYEVTDDASRTIGLTLVRGFEVALTTVSWRWERHPEMKGSQSLGEQTFRYLVFPHAGDWDSGGVLQQADRFNVPLEPAQAGPHAGHLPRRFSFLELAPEALVVSSIKRCEDRPSLIVRVFNPTARDVTGTLHTFQQPDQVRYVHLNEAPVDQDGPDLGKNQITFPVGAKKIVTMELSFDNR
ncbi:MAG: alpha-mannosidase, partial [Pirellulales bacterium]